MRKQYSIWVPRGLYGQDGPYVFASMATSNILAAAPLCQSAITETPLKADCRTSGDSESYTTPYCTIQCRAHQESQAQTSTRRRPLWIRKDIPQRST